MKLKEKSVWITAHLNRMIIHGGESDIDPTFKRDSRIIVDEMIRDPVMAKEYDLQKRLYAAHLSPEHQSRMLQVINSNPLRSFHAKNLRNPGAS